MLFESIFKQFLKILCVKKRNVDKIYNNNHIYIAYIEKNLLLSFYHLVQKC